jgi:hypothetical protein
MFPALSLKKNKKPTKINLAGYATCSTFLKRPNKRKVSTLLNN